MFLGIDEYFALGTPLLAAGAAPTADAGAAFFGIGCLP
jgi:hypothetical protein